MAAWIREAFSGSAPAKLGALLAERGLGALKDRMDPRRFNGGPFLGLNGIAIKSHGGTDALGFASAIEVGYEMPKAASSSGWPPTSTRSTASSANRNRSAARHDGPTRQTLCHCGRVGPALRAS